MTKQRKKLDWPQGIKSHIGRSLLWFMKSARGIQNFGPTLPGEDKTFEDEQNVKAVDEQFKKLCVYSVDDFIKVVKDLTESSAISREALIKAAEKDFNYANDQERFEAGQAKIKGDLFELFCAAYFNMNGATHGLYGTRVAPRNQVGWDFEARNKNESKCLIQAKYVYAGAYDGNLTTFWKETATTEGVVNESGALSSVLITSAHKHSLKHAEAKGTFTVIDRNHLKKRCDNPGFWKTFNEDYLKIVFYECWK